MSILIRRAEARDLLNLGTLDAAAFSGNGTAEDAHRWLESRLGDATFRIWLAEYSGEFAGFITWQIHGGFNRAVPLTELERMAVLEKFRRNKIGQTLVEETLGPVGAWIRETNKRATTTGSIVVWAVADAPVNHLYRKYFPEVAGFQMRYSGRPENLLRGSIVLS